MSTAAGLCLPQARQHHLMSTCLVDDRLSFELETLPAEPSPELLVLPRKVGPATSTLLHAWHVSYGIAQMARNRSCIRIHPVLTLCPVSLAYIQSAFADLAHDFHRQAAAKS